ncbi:Nitrogen permease regulator 2 [Malassezia brasiliensis]|uniref:Nitrogen permease regulator 2 n=1 Tax=Malassezia brasiliensis TaxID=1821822 RepID=A0AAF0DQE6_9BASI|nr:Nitrogen permease regulator 2 [Malassezia brasiliensis]
MHGRSMGASSFLPRLEAAFLAIFHPLDGPKVLFQVPENIFVDQRNTDASAEPQRHPMLDFASLSEYVIPKAPLCGRLITSEVRSHNPSQHVPRSYKVMGFPVLLEQSEKYQRNYFIFNLCFVFDSRASVSAYEPIVRKCGRSLRLLEEESSFVSRLENLPRLYMLVEQLYEDLNAYYETFIALPEAPALNPTPYEPPSARESNLTLVSPAELDAMIAQASGPLARVRQRTHSRAWPPNAASPELTDASEPERPGTRGTSPARARSKSPPPHGLGRTVRDAINLKLFPSYANPPSVNDWDVPVLLIDLEKHANGSWDLTLVKLLPHINGVNHAKRIAQLADTDLGLVKQCIEHLLYYSYAILIDIFQFSNMYAVRPQMARMLDDKAMGPECAAYVTLPHQEPLPAPDLWRMYSKLEPGRTLYEWADELGECAQRVDIRRFVTFGIIKGFLRRIHRYPTLVYASEDRTAEVEADWPRRNAEVIAPTSFASAIQYASSASARSAVSSWLQFAGASAIPVSSSDMMHSDHDSLFSLSTSARAEVPRRSALESRPSARATAHRPTATAIDVASLAYGAAEPASLRDELGWSRTPLRSPRTSVSIPIPPELPGLLDGLHCDDELCVRFGVSWSELNRMLQWIGSPYAATDVSRILEESSSSSGGGQSTWDLSDLRVPWARAGHARNHDSGSYFTPVPGRTRPAIPRPGSSHDGTTPHGPSDPFATREVPSRVKLIAL